MTNPIGSGSAAVPLRPQPAPAPAIPATSAVKVDVSRAAASPIYVYRVTEAATGRTLVEIPTEKTIDADDMPGRRLDAKA